MPNQSTRLATARHSVAYANTKFSLLPAFNLLRHVSHRHSSFFELISKGFRQHAGEAFL